MMGEEEMMTVSHRDRLVLLAALVALGMAWPAWSHAQDVKVFTPRESTSKGLSSAVNMVDPHLRKSLELARRAEAMAGVAQSTMELKEAAELVMQAYFLQRAAHGGINKQARGRSKAGDVLDVQDRTIHASRQNLIGAQNQFRLAKGVDMKRIEGGLEYLRAAIKQTQTVLGMRHGG